MRELPVQEDEIGFFLFDQAHRILAVVGRDGVVSHPGDAILQSEPDIGIILDDQDFGAHGFAPSDVPRNRQSRKCDKLLLGREQVTILLHCSGAGESLVSVVRGGPESSP